MSKLRAGSYREILKSSSISGGAQTISLVLGMARTKLVALMLGPNGVGLIALYESTFGIVGTLTGLGIGQSAVRQVAEAHGSGQSERIGRTVRALRRVCWITGAIGMLLTAALARPLSVWTFGKTEHAIPIGVLGITLLLTAVSGGQSALVRGVRRIGDLARMQVYSSVASLAISVGLYGVLRERGIVPVFLTCGIVNLGFSWWFARSVPVPAANLDWSDTLKEGRNLVKLGLAFMFSSLLGAGVGLATRAWILRQFDLEANGLYQASWSISGVFAGFILTAMGMDFYPRLTAASADNNQVNLLVNEQAEIGMLLALPGLIATVVFSRWIIQVLYSTSFSPAAQLLPWFVIGIFGRVVSWPMGFIQLAKGSAGWFAATQGIFNLVHLLFIWLGLKWFGLVGVALAFALAYVMHTVLSYGVARSLTGFQLAAPVRKLLVGSCVAMASVVAMERWAPPLVVALGGGVTVLVTGIICLRQICRRLGGRHRVSQWSKKLPVAGGWLTRGLSD